MGGKERATSAGPEILCGCRQVAWGKESKRQWKRRRGRKMLLWKDGPRKAQEDGCLEKGNVPKTKGLVESIITRILQRKLPMLYKLLIIMTVETKVMIETAQKVF
jgi:hypothetical protein